MKQNWIFFLTKKVDILDLSKTISPVTCLQCGNDLNNSVNFKDHVKSHINPYDHLWCIYWRKKLKYLQLKIILVIYSSFKNICTTNYCPWILLGLPLPLFGGWVGGVGGGGVRTTEADADKVASSGIVSFSVTIFFLPSSPPLTASSGPSSTSPWWFSCWQRWWRFNNSWWKFIIININGILSVIYNSNIFIKNM